MRDPRAFEFPAHFRKTGDPAAARNQGYESACLARQTLAPAAKSGSIARAILCPPNGVQQAGRSEAIRAQHLLDEDPDGSFEFM